jgi:crossover junction endodeoxyribonuclease RuvC
VKTAVAAHGLANKAQVQVVRRLPKLPVAPGKDTADALGLAISHAHAAVTFSAPSRQIGLKRRQRAL